jgi:transmembrane sensor
VTQGGITIESRSPEQAAEALGWLSGNVVFHGTPLRDAIMEFNRFNAHKLVIMDPKAGEIRVDGSFKVGNTDGFSRLISQVFPVEVVRKQNTSEIYSAE